MSIRKTHSKFQSGALTKAGFIEEAYASHALLFEYPEILKGTNIADIWITEGELSVGFKDPAIRLKCPPADRRVAPVEALNFGDYEASEFKLLRQLIEKMGSNLTFYDVGANVGFYSIGLQRCFPNLKILSFEPIPQTCEQFRANIALNGMSDILVHPFGLSNETGSFTFHTYPSQSVAASRERILEGVPVETVTCELKTLDAVWKAHGAPIDLIKCDVEGAERMVYAGGMEALTACRPVIFSEMLRKWCSRYGYHPNDLIADLSVLGYRCFGVSEQGLRACPEVTETTVETNYLFLHPERHPTLMPHP
jgi:FkbM family methyltransferase